MEQKSNGIATKMEIMLPENINVKIRRIPSLEIIGDHSHFDEHRIPTDTNLCGPFSSVRGEKPTEMFNDFPKKTQEVITDSARHPKTNETQSVPVKRYPRHPNSNTEFRKISVIAMIENRLNLNNRQKRKRSSLPKKQLIISICLLLGSLIMFIFGTVIAVNSNNPNQSIAFWVIGVLCGLPGVYYALKFCKVCYATSSEDRNRALEEIPRE